MKLTVGTRGRPPRKFAKKVAKKPLGPPLSVQQKKQVNTIVKKKQEIKVFDVAGNSTFDVVGTMAKWFAIPQGTDVSQRIGNDIRATHISLNYNIQLADPFNQIRIILFQWHEDDAVDVPTKDSILYTAGISSYINALTFFSNKDKYKILLDRTHTVAPGNSLGSNYKFTVPYIKVPHTRMSFNGSATNGKNMIYMFAVSDSTTVSHPVVSMQARLHYRDA